MTMRAFDIYTVCIRQAHGYREMATEYDRLIGIWARLPKESKHPVIESLQGCREKMKRLANADGIIADLRSSKHIMEQIVSGTADFARRWNDVECYEDVARAFEDVSVADVYISMLLLMDDVLYTKFKSFLSEAGNRDLLDTLYKKAPAKGIDDKPAIAPVNSSKRKAVDMKETQTAEGTGTPSPLKKRRSDEDGEKQPTEESAKDKPLAPAVATRKKASVKTRTVKANEST